MCIRAICLLLLVTTTFELMPREVEKKKKNRISLGFLRRTNDTYIVMY